MTQLPESKLQFKAVYNPLVFSPEFLAWYGKRQAELYMEMRRLEDEAQSSLLQLRSVRFRWEFIPIGAVLGAIIGGML